MDSRSRALSGPSREKKMDERQWSEQLASCHDSIEYLREHGAQARAEARQGLAALDGFPRSSLPESSIASGRIGDPTGDIVVTLAGGKLASDRGEATVDTWQGPRDPLAMHVRQMEREVVDAANRLLGAVDALHKAMGTRLPETRDERCGCGVSRSAATKHGTAPRGWVVSAGACKACADRIGRVAS